MVVVSFVMLVSGVYVYGFIPFWVDVILPRVINHPQQQQVATETPKKEEGMGKRGKNSHPVEGFFGWKLCYTVTLLRPCEK